MAMETLTAVLNGESSRLQDAIDDVTQSAAAASRTLEAVEEDLENIATAAEKAEQGLDGISSELGQIGAAGSISQDAMDEVSDELSSISRNTQIAAEQLSLITKSFGLATGGAQAAQGAIDELGDEMSDATADAMGLDMALLTEAVSAEAAEQASEGAAEAVDDLGDEARSAAGGMFAASGAAEALSLSSSALSVNVGFVTVALRNLTTQVPLLVTSLGTLATAFIGVASAAGLAAAGVGAVLAAGFLAEAQQLSDSLGESVSTMEAMRAIGQEVKRMMLEAIQPLLEAEGVVETFQSAIEGLARTVHMFSGAIAASFSNAEEEFFTIAEFMDIVGEAWHSNLRDVTEGLMTLWTNIGPIFADMLVFMIESFDEFAEFVSKITRQLSVVFGEAGDGLTDFLGGLIQLGVKIASGLAPIMSGFIEVVNDVVGVFNELEGGTVGNIIRIVALIAVVNKLAGVMGALLAPFTAGIASLLQMRGAANSFGGALVKTTDNFLGFLKTHISGFGALSKALGVFTANTEDGVSTLGRLGKAIDKNGGLTRLMANKMGFGALKVKLFGEAAEDAADDADNMNGVLSGMGSRVANLSKKITTMLLPSFLQIQQVEGPVPEGTSRKLFRATGRTESLSSALGRATDKMSAFASTIAGGFGDAAASSIGQVDDALAGLGVTATDSTTMVASGMDEVQDNFGFTGTVTTVEPKQLTGFDAIRHKVSGKLGKLKNSALSSMADFRDGLISNLQGISDRFFGGMANMVRDPIGTVRSGLSSLAMTYLEGVAGIGGKIVQGGSRIKSAFGGLVNTVGEHAGRIRTKLANMSLADAVMAPFNAATRVARSGVDRMMQGFNGLTRGVRAGVSKMADGFDSFSTRMRSMVDTGVTQFMRLNNVSLPSFGGFRKRLSGMKNSVKQFAVQSIASMNRATNSMIGKLAKLNIATLQSAFSFNTAGGSAGFFGGIITTVTGLLSTQSGVLGTLSGALSGMSLASAVASAQEIILGAASQIATGGITALTAAASLLASVLGGVAIAAGALVAALAVIVVVGGAVALMLAKIGQSGQDAESIIEGLLDKLRTIGETVMPIFVESANMLQDIFVSIMAPIEELIAGFQDIAVELGLMEKGAGQGMSGFDMFISVLESLKKELIPIMDDVSKFARLIGNVLANRIKDGMEAFVDFLDKIDAQEKLAQYIQLFRDVAQRVIGFKDEIMDLISIVRSSFDNSLGNLMDTVMDVVETFKEAFGLGGSGGGEGGGMFDTLMSALRGFWDFMLGLVGPIIDLVGSIMSALFGLADVIISVTGGAIKVLIGIVSGLMDFLNDLLGIFGMSLSGLFDTAVSAGQDLLGMIGPIISMTADLIDIAIVAGEVLFKVLGEVAGVIGAWLGPAFDGLANIILGVVRVIKVAMDVVIGTIMGALDFIFGYFNTIFESIGMLMQGNFMGAVTNIIDFFVSSFSKILKFVRSIFGRLGTIITDTVGNALNIVGDFITNLPGVFMDAFTGIGNAIANAIAGPWNDSIAGELVEIDVPGWVPEYGGESWSLDIPEMGGGNLPSAPSGDGGDGDGGGGEDEDLVADTKDVGSDDILEGAETAKNVGSEAAQRAGLAGPSGGPTYNENNTVENTTNVDARPEDKGTISRVVKDAMEQANSFERKRNGQTGG